MYKILLLLALAFTTAPVVGAQFSMSEKTIESEIKERLEKVRQDIAEFEEALEETKNRASLPLSVDARKRNQERQAKLSNYLENHKKLEKRFLDELNKVAASSLDELSKNQESANN